MNLALRLRGVVFTQRGQFDEAIVVLEKALKKEEKKTKHDLGREEFLKRVWQWKEEKGGIIINQLKKLGCSCDWTRERFTMDPEYSRCVQKVFVELYKKGQEGHWKQYNELRTKLTKLAENGAYSKEFITQSDWFHTGEGMRAFLLLGLSDPNDEIFRALDFVLGAFEHDFVMHLDDEFRAIAAFLQGLALSTQHFFVILSIQN